jgi:hypothetical protein
LKTFDSLYHFPLDKFRKSYLASHLEHSALYWQWRDQQVQDSIRKTQETHRMLLAIKMEKGRFTKQVDSLMNDIYAKQSAAAVDVLRADTNALTSFRKRMDKILTDNLFETHPFNTKTSGTYAVVVKDNNVIDIVEKPTKKTTDPIFLAYYQSPLYEVESQISNIKLDRRKVGINVDSAYRSLLYQQKSRISRAKLDSAFLKTFTDSVYTALTPYRKQVDMPTSYDYKFSYSSSSAWQRWGKRGEKYKNLKTGENIDNLKLINDFHARQKNTKNGKYQVRVNKSQLNDSIFGPHIDSVYRKYKYLTHIGFNVGVIITGDEFSTEGKTIDKGLLYFDFFVIYHHFGAFGGFASKSVLDESDLDGYSEGGLYVAPGNYFFFKLGLASFNGKISGLLGGTLVFPFVQFEGGYNFALKRAYVMAGVNIPINR